MTHTTPHIALVTIEVFIPHSHSLKQKRGATKSLIERLRARFNASVAELDYLDQWQRSLIGITMISNNRSTLEKAYSGISQLASETPDISITAIGIEWV